VRRTKPNTDQRTSAGLREQAVGPEASAAPVFTNLP
jgi:hypothetical protein